MIGQPIPCANATATTVYLLADRVATLAAVSDYLLAQLPHDPCTHSGANRIGELLATFTELRPEIKAPYRHLVLSLPPGESLGKQWVTCAEEMLRALGVDPRRHVFLAVAHHDRPHEHCHLVWNRVGIDGSLIRDQLGDGAIVQQVCRNLEARFGLRPLHSSIPPIPETVASSGKRKQKRPTRAEFEMAKRGIEPDKERMRRKLREAWPSPGEVVHFAELTQRWEARGIQVEMCRKGTRVGLVYLIDGSRKKACELGDEFLWKALEPHIHHDLSPEDVAAIRTIRPGTQPSKGKLPSARSITPEPTPQTPPAGPKRALKPRLDINPLALVEDAYATFSATHKEQQRLRISGLLTPHRGPGHPRSAHSRDLRRPPARR